MAPLVEAAYVPDALCVPPAKPLGMFKPVLLTACVFVSSCGRAKVGSGATVLLPLPPNRPPTSEPRDPNTDNPPNMPLPPSRLETPAFSVAFKSVLKSEPAEADERELEGLPN